MEDVALKEGRIFRLAAKQSSMARNDTRSYLVNLRTYLSSNFNSIASEKHWRFLLMELKALGKFEEVGTCYLDN